MSATLESNRDDRAAVEKAFSLLLSLGEVGPEGLGVSELARRVDLSKSTAHRVLGMMERNGVVERIGTDYRLGARLLRLGRRRHPVDHDRTRDLLIPHVAALYERTHETVHLAAMHGSDVIYLAKLYGSRHVRSPSRIGGLVPAHCTAVGQVLMAYDQAAAARVLSGALRPLTPTTITDPAELASRLLEIRRQGVGYDRQEAQVGLTCVAAPVLAPGGRPVAALSVSVAAGRTDPGLHEHELRRVCAEASRTIGLDQRAVSQESAVWA